jgi:hypothetical protein
MNGLDQFLPDYHFRERHRIVIPCDTSQAHVAARELRVDEVSRAVGVLLYLRELPARLFGQHRPEPQPAAASTFLSLLDQNGFVRLTESPEQFVFGCIAKCWKPAPEILPVYSPEQYLACARTGFAKIAFDLRFAAVPGGTVVSTETRVTVDALGARLAFACYWVLIRLGSGLIRRLWLRAIYRKALQGEKVDAQLTSTTKRVLLTCGVLSLLFGAFHALFWPLLNWPATLAYMQPEHRALMQMFGFCMTPMFFALAWAYFRYPGEIATTALGRGFSMISVTIFGFRALAEPVFGI